MGSPRNACGCGRAHPCPVHLSLSRLDAYPETRYVLGQMVLATMLNQLEDEEREMHIFRLREMAVVQRAVYNNPEREAALRWALAQLGEPV